MRPGFLREMMVLDDRLRNELTERNQVTASISLSTFRDKYLNPNRDSRQEVDDGGAQHECRLASKAAGCWKRQQC